MDFELDLERRYFEYVENRSTFLKKAVKENTVESIYLHTPFIKIEDLELLLNAGADPNILDRDGFTVLQMINGYLPDFIPERLIPDYLKSVIEKTKLLLKFGADPNLIKIPFNRAPLTCSYCAEQTKLLLEAGANVNHVEWDGYTAIERSKSKEQLRLLLESGAEFDLNDLLQTFISRNQKDCIEELLKFMITQEVKKIRKVIILQRIYRNRLMNPDHPYCKRKLNEEFNEFQKATN